MLKFKIICHKKKLNKEDGGSGMFVMDIKTYFELCKKAENLYTLLLLLLLHPIALEDRLVLVDIFFIKGRMHEI